MQNLWPTSEWPVLESALLGRLPHASTIWIVIWCFFMPLATHAQLPFAIHQGDAVPRDVREIYDKGVAYLVEHQAKDGSWQGGQSGPGVTGMALMTLLASGEDPNFGKYRQPIRKAVKNIVDGQNESTGYLGNSMYHHGFGLQMILAKVSSVEKTGLS